MVNQKEAYKRAGKDEKFVFDCLRGLCCGMHVLNVWWAYLISKIAVKFAIKGKEKDEGNNVE